MYSEHIFGTRNCTRNFIQTWLSRDFFLLLFPEAQVLGYFEAYHSLSRKLKEKGGPLKSIYFTSNYFFWGGFAL